MLCTSVGKRKGITTKWALCVFRPVNTAVDCISLKMGNWKAVKIYEASSFAIGALEL